jgi:hypothetical protein
MSVPHIIICALTLVLVIMTIVAVRKQSEAYAVCADSLAKSFIPFKCLATDKDQFKQQCIQYTLDNGTVSPLIAEEICSRSDTPIYSITV